MRVLIMSDMEGVSGIVVWEQVSGGWDAPLSRLDAALCLPISSCRGAGGERFMPAAGF